MTGFFGLVMFGKLRIETLVILLLLHRFFVLVLLREVILDSDLDSDLLRLVR